MVRCSNPTRAKRPHYNWLFFLDSSNFQCSTAPRRNDIRASAALQPGLFGLGTSGDAAIAAMRERGLFLPLFWISTGGALARQSANRKKECASVLRCFRTSMGSNFLTLGRVCRFWTALFHALCMVFKMQDRTDDRGASFWHLWPQFCST